MLSELAFCAAAIAANLLTPTIRTAAERALVYGALRIRPSCRISALIRLERLREEREEFERLQTHPLEFARRAAKLTALRSIALWATLVAISYGWFSLAVQNLMQTAWGSVVFAPIGYTGRFPVSAVTGLYKHRKLCDIDGLSRTEFGCPGNITGLAEPPLRAPTSDRNRFKQRYGLHLVPYD